MNPSLIGVQASKGFSEIKASLAVLVGLFVEVAFMGFLEEGPVVFEVVDDTFGVGVVVVFDAVDEAFGVGVVVDVVFDAGVVVFGAGGVVVFGAGVVVFGAGVDVVLVVGVFAVAPCVICCGADDNL